MIPTHEVHEVLKQHTIGDGLDLVVDSDKSHGSWVHDALTGKEYLDCYSQFASQPIGWNHPKFDDYSADLGRIARVKMANSDMYCPEYAHFVREFASVTKDFDHYFFVDGGTLGVENALKCAFDWKAQKDGLRDEDSYDWADVIHLKEAFHGRSGYTMSMTNTLPVKTKWYPKFRWTRILNPKLHFPDCRCVEQLEEVSLEQAKEALRTGRVAAIVLEAIQGEGGDNHFRPEYLQALRALADEYEAMLIVDEVQTGVGLTGKMWAYQHFGIVPDMIAFGKKTQVCGFACTKRVDDVENVFKVSGRINSTWGGNIVDMVRFIAYKRIIEEENLVQNAAEVGEHFLDLLRSLQGALIQNVRGRGLMIAFDLPTTERRNEVLDRMSNKMLALKCGPKSIRLRPHLTFSKQEAEVATEIIMKSL